MTLQAAQAEATRRTRPHHAERTAQTQAAFFLPHLRPGMDLLDLGCGPGSITVGLAAAVAPGRTTGIDLDPDPIDGITVVAGDVLRLPFPDASFDAIFASALLQHLADPLAALREARRVARPGAVIGVVDADWDSELIYPDNETLRRSGELIRRYREGTSPTVGKRLRHLLGEAGFERAEGSARVTYEGTAAEIRNAASNRSCMFRYPATIERAVTHGWATAQELEHMSNAWLAWGEEPGAFVASFWCEAIAWNPTTPGATDPVVRA
jgi:SAM-dependent methyltransferase